MFGGFLERRSKELKLIEHQRMDCGGSAAFLISLGKFKNDEESYEVETEINSRICAIPSII